MTADGVNGEESASSITICPFNCFFAPRYELRPLHRTVIKATEKECDMKEMRLLLHVSDVDRWSMALGNAINFIKDVGKDRADVVIVANGAAAAAYAYSDKTETMEVLSDRGVQFKACRNSLKKLCAEGSVCINEDALPAFVEIVPAGISELVRKQQEGYAYVKP
jgi:intracellular sulfur oxidation DsrE/DsrF family protein